jgi:asparagine synthase (glutamine-hydrolysing)
MCGIAGLVRKDGQSVGREAVSAMTRLVLHRGPDGAGHYVHKNLGLGHTRLAIIDRSAAANQPMHSIHRRLTLVFNGEIYNYLELRDELRNKGHEFATQSDTEVILEAYAEWGSECVQRFNGMWAFALHDHARNRLFCSRDRFGVKPFYYVDTACVFAFGSEIKQLLEFVPRREANSKIVLTFLATGLTDYSEETFFEGVTKLLPGHNLFVELGTGAVERKLYYEPVPLDLNGATEEQLQERFLEILTSSVDLRLRSDVPVGTCLSGGLDSSAIAALAAPRYLKRSNQPFCAVTGVSIDPKSDESAYARQVVQHSGLRWLTTRPTSADFLAAMADITYHQDEPIPGPSPLMQYFVMRTARENGIPVMLDGQGADELLLGYGMYIGVNIRTIFREQGPLAAMRAFQRGVAQDPRMSVGAAIKYIVGVGTPRLWYLRARRRLPCVRFPRRAIPQVLKDYTASTRNLRTFQCHEIAKFTLPALLRYEDRNSMAFGIETRLPFLDYRMVELCLSLPFQLKVRGGWAKWILRRAMAGIVPDSIMWRKDKIGFEAPQEIWLQDQNEAVRRTIMSSDLIRCVADGSSLKAAYPRMSLGERWRLFSLAMWSRQFEVGMTGRPFEECLIGEESEGMPSCR